MNTHQKPNPKQNKPASLDKRVCLSVVSDKERNEARIPVYTYILP